MMKYITTLRRIVGGSVLALFSLIAMQANAQFLYETPEFDYELAVSEGTDLTDSSALTSQIGGLPALYIEALAPEAKLAANRVCITLKSTIVEFGSPNCMSSGSKDDPADGVWSDNTTPSGNFLQAKSDATLDFETNPSLDVVFTGHDVQDGATVRDGSHDTFTVTLTITDVDEGAKAKESPKVRYLRPGSTFSVNVLDQFTDPEGDSVNVTGADILVCENAELAPGMFLADDAAPMIGEDGTITTPTAVKITLPDGTSGEAEVCEPLMTSGSTTSHASSLLSVSQYGPTLVTMVHPDPSGTGQLNTDEAALASGTYDTKIYIRSLSTGSSGGALSSDWHVLHVMVKVGVNNTPQFAGGALGYSAKVAELAADGSSTVSIGPAVAGAWNAADLDEEARGGTQSKDMLTFRLAGQDDKGLVTLGGTKDAPMTVSLKQAGSAFTLEGKNLDFEDESNRMFAVTVEVTDNWIAEPVTVPVHVEVTDVNELVVNADALPKADAVKLLAGGDSYELDLSTVFSDPEGDPISYTVYSDEVEGAAAVEAGVVTVKPTLIGEEASSTITVRIIATDANDAPRTNGADKTETASFMVSTRKDNMMPMIDLLAGGTVAVGYHVFEDLAPGSTVNTDAEGKAAPIMVTDDADDKPIPSLDSTAFTAEYSDGGILIKVGEKGLNYEAQTSYSVTLTVADSWTGKATPDHSLQIQIAVGDSNDAPMLKDAEAKIAEQAIVVNGSSSMAVGDYFTDEDGDRLLITGASSDTAVVAVTNLGLDVVMISGVSVGMAKVTITAADPDGATASTTYDVTVGMNNAPTVANAIDDMELKVGAFYEIADLGGIFSEGDSGDMIVGIDISSSDSDVLLVAEEVDDVQAVLVGRAEGMATVSITASDQAGNMVTEDFMVTVFDNEAPTVAAAIEGQSLDRVEPLGLDISGTFTDPDGDMLTLSAMVSDDMILTAEIMEGMLTLTGLAVGTADVTLTAMDPDGASAMTSFSVTVDNVAPVVAEAIADQTMDRIDDLTLDLMSTFSDQDGMNGLTLAVAVNDAAIVSATLTDANLMLDGLGVGTTSVTVSATDPEGAMAESTFSVEVINLAPVVAEAITDQSTNRVDDLSIDVSGTFADPEMDALTLAATAADGTILGVNLVADMLTIDGLGVGDTMVTVTATDEYDAMVDLTFTVTVENLAPQAVASLSPVALEVGGTSATQSISGIFVDDGDPLAYTLSLSQSGIADSSLADTTLTYMPLSRGQVTLTVTATDPYGESASVSGSVTVGDGELKAVAAKSLAGFGRALLASVSSSVGSRLMNDDRSSDLTLDSFAALDNESINRTNEVGGEQAWSVVNTATSVDQSQDNLSGVDALQSLVGSQFALNLGSSENPSSWSVWGNVDRQSYEGTSYDGLASNVYLGVDVTAGECWLFGVAVASNTGESDYTYGTATQTMDTSLTTVLPYISYEPNDKTSIWGVAGIGSGELDTTVVGADNAMSDLSANIAMIGARQHLTTTGRLDLNLRADAAMASIETEDGTGAADSLIADVSRLRAGLEGSFTTETGQGGTLTPFGQVSLRSDGGDGETGSGIEIAGGVRMASNTFTLEARGRMLVMHSADDYSENGFSLMATLNPSANGTGVSVTLAPRWGGDASGTDVLWADTVTPLQNNPYRGLNGLNLDNSTKALDTQIGYGLLVAQERMLLKPFVDMSVSDASRRQMLIGASLAQINEANANLAIQLALGRVEERSGEVGGKVGLNATLRF